MCNNLKRVLFYCLIVLFLYTTRFKQQSQLSCTSPFPVNHLSHSHHSIPNVVNIWLVEVDLFLDMFVAFHSLVASRYRYPRFGQCLLTEHLQCISLWDCFFAVISLSVEHCTDSSSCSARLRLWSHQFFWPHKFYRFWSFVPVLIFGLSAASFSCWTLWSWMPNPMSWYLFAPSFWNRL